jgi:hypothetical protein
VFDVLGDISRGRPITRNTEAVGRYTIGPITEVVTRRRKKFPVAVTFANSLKQPLDLVWRWKIAPRPGIERTPWLS